MTNLFKASTIFLTLTVLIGCAEPQKIQKESPPTLVNCTLVISGIGTYSTDPQFNQQWNRITKAIGDSFEEIINTNELKSSRLHVPVGVSDEERSRAISSGIARSRCQNILKTSHSIHTKNSERFFSFTVELTKLKFMSSDSDKRGSFYELTGVRSKTYEFPYTQEQFDSLRIGDFVNIVFPYYGEVLLQQPR
ncbi:hypothetical protein VVD49_01245 [Uliginosibacterium sp. H3]|uniref:Lipoprotein n=1 Tax=Uliginosibacterium silvisoli TaxID=3114758 RepID=A0ABU6JXI8_9RHOO|nr:hypothetical protein [Uliginosibacterium sp. H3]